MQIIRTISEIQTWSNAQKSVGKSIGFVPTMGYLHQGHLTLCREARSKVDQLVVSIFVNPLQFGPKEDLSRYPRDEAGDLAKLRSMRVDVVFIPEVSEMYPSKFFTKVSVSNLDKKLCGAFRGGHFDGVATVVAKLFNLVSPNKAYFGLKDYQQYLIIKKMVSDLSMNIEIVGIPTVREGDGLAMSSRNSYLTVNDRAVAVILYQSLSLAKSLYEEGERDFVKIKETVLNILSSDSKIEVDYVEVLDAETLSEPVSNRPTVVAIAAKVHGVRLIDNVVLSPTLQPPA